MMIALLDHLMRPPYIESKRLNKRCSQATYLRLHEEGRRENSPLFFVSIIVFKYSLYYCKGIIIVKLLDLYL